MKNEQKTQEAAENRFKAITPVLLCMEESTDIAKLAQVKRDVCAQNGISRRTLGRWVDAHKKDGFNGLKPKPKTYTGEGALTEEMIAEAIMLRREVPLRSVATIIEIMEMEGKAPKGLIKESTLQDKLMERGFSARHMRLYQQTGTAARRFQRLSRNDLWQADIKYGPFIKTGGKNQQIYLVAFIDDATRYIVHAEFYDNLEQVIVENCLRKAITKHGLPSRLYFDNGGQFRNKWMQRACAKLDIKLLFCKPFSAASKGKIERFNLTIDTFLAEAKLMNLTALDGYNHYLDVWLSECYHKKEHSTLNATPFYAFNSSTNPIRPVTPQALAEAFLHQETRKVDKSGCISFENRLYEVGLPLIGQRVEILYDPADTGVITAVHPATGFTKRVSRLEIGVKTGAKPRLPDSMLPVAAGSSRLLELKDALYQDSYREKVNAIQYSALDGTLSCASALAGWPSLRSPASQGYTHLGICQSSHTGQTSGTDAGNLPPENNAYVVGDGGDAHV
jgi:transposase InsO family protein